MTRINHGLWMFIAFAALNVIVFILPRTCGKIRSDTGLAAGSGSALPTPAAATQTPRTEDSPLLEAGVSFSGQVAQAEEQPVDATSGRVVGSSPALATIFSQYPDSFLPTEEGLIDATLGLWLNEDFLALTQDEAHELLALDDSMGMKGPDSMMAIVGPLPTEGDCRIGFRSPAVQDALQEVCLYEIDIAERGSVPLARRCAGSQGRIETLIALRDSARSVLMAELEKATTFGSWALWERLYARWSR